MPTSILYLLTILLWGSSWYFIKLQLGDVAPQISLVYRFLIAGSVLLIYCLIRGYRLRYHLSDHARFAFMGLFLFNLNYILIYYATYDLTTGLISVVFSSIQIFNMVIAFLVIKDRITAPMLGGALIGIIGITLVFWPEIDALDLSGPVLQSIGLTLGATLSASIGMVSSARFQRQNYPVLQTNAWGMTWGCTWMLLYVLITGIEFRFDTSVTYVGSLLFLAIPSTVLGFGSFLTLVGRLGAGRASYAMVVFPIVALGLSTLFEDYQWTALASFGVALAIIGNVIIMLGKQTKAK